LDREIRVGVPARRADGSGRRTAGRWVAPPAVATVRFKRPSGRRTRLSRARLGKAARVPRGADDPQGPNRPGAGGFARRPPGRGSWGLSFSEFRPSSPGARVRIGCLPRRTAQQHPPYPVPAGHRSSSSEPTHLSAVLAVDLAVSRCPSQGRFRSCRRPPRFCRAGTARLADRLPARRARRNGPEALTLL
jgi:hypothetical protein